MPGWQQKFIPERIIFLCSPMTELTLTQDHIAVQTNKRQSQGRLCLRLAVVLSMARSLCAHCQQNELLRSRTIKRGGSSDSIYIKKTILQPGLLSLHPSPTLRVDPAKVRSHLFLFGCQTRSSVDTIRLGRGTNGVWDRAWPRDFNPFIWLNVEVWNVQLQLSEVLYFSCYVLCFK